MAANRKQVGGTHYKVVGEEHWDRVDKLDLDYFQGQITKYVERWREKNGVEDLEKARHFLEKYIELARTEGTTVNTRAAQAAFSRRAEQAERSQEMARKEVRAVRRK